jgi:YD repeat-containing protein
MFASIDLDKRWGTPMMQKPHALRAGLAAATSAALIALASSVGAATVTVTYTYDALGRVSSAIYSSSGSTTTITYHYDSAGNRTSTSTALSSNASAWGAFSWGQGVW